METLKQLFPEFSWAAEADTFLTELEQKLPKIIEQMRQRRIAKIETQPLLFPGGCKIENGRFVIVFNDQSTFEEKVETFGHEIGHTFHYDLTSDDLRLLCPEALESEVIFYRVEEFCRLFSQRWLRFNSIKEIGDVIGN